MPKKLIKNIVLIFVFVAALLILSSCMLRWVTNHGKCIEAPDFTSLTPAECEVLAKESGVRVEVIDTAYVRSVRRGCIFTQDPAAGSMVKKNRKIRLVVNASVPRKVAMPNVVECPVRQAVSDLTSKGFIVGRLHYVPGYDDRVQAQLINGKNVAPGSTVESGSVVDLRVGFDPLCSTTSAPDVRGKRSIQAQKEIKERSLNVRRPIYDSSVRSYADSINAVVWRQTPEAFTTNLTKGSEMTIWLSVDPAKTGLE